MKLLLQTLALFFIVTSSNAQNIVLKGKIVSETTKLPLESATVYIASAKDSTLIDYTIADRNGNFSLTTRKISNPILLKVSFVGYSEYSQKHEEILENKDFGIIQILDLPQDLDEIVIKSQAPPIRIKKDTLEFDAASFKVRPDSNVETLLKQLPGVEIDEEGKITVNGKEVNEILVNGKPFFDKDGKIALQNLPADIINKVQVSDTKTKQEKASGETATSNNASINLTIDEDKNKGLFGKFMGGYGSDERYESSLLLNYFKGKQKISILASSNNINSSGFSMNEIFDSMGGGRNRSVYTSDNGSFGINGMRFGGGNGITVSNIVGLNYSDELRKDLDITSSYFYTDAKSENLNITKQTNLLPSGNYITNSQSKTINDQYSHNINTEFEYKIDSTMTVGVSPKFVNSKSEYSNIYNTISEDLDGLSLNDGAGESYSETTTDKFENEIYFNKSFKKKRRYLNLSFNNENDKTNGSSIQNNITRFFTDTDNDGIIDNTTVDQRNQIEYTVLKRNRYNFNFGYNEPVLDSVALKFELDVELEERTESKATFDLDEITNRYSNKNDFLSDELFTKEKTVGPAIGINSSKDKYYFGVTLGTNITQLDYNSNYLGIDSQIKKEYIYPNYSLYGNYKFSKSSSIYFNYNYFYQFASARQILPIENLSNAMNTIIGNPDLSPTKSHYFYTYFRNYDYAAKSGFTFYMGGNVYNDDIVSVSTYDESRKRTTTYTNLSGAYSGWYGGNWSKSIKNEAHSYRFGFGINGGFNKGKGFTDGVLFESQSYTFGPRINFTYEYGELLTINPTYNLTYRNTDYTNYLIDKASNVSHRFNLQTTTYWPKNLVFGNDFGYTYNSNISDGFKKDFYLWNTSLGYNFMDKKLLAKVKVYDVLNQNQSSSNSISATSVRDEENTVLKRYVMFSLTYKLEKFAGKDKNKRGRNFMILD